MKFLHLFSILLFMTLTAGCGGGQVMRSAHLSSQEIGTMRQVSGQGTISPPLHTIPLYEELHYQVHWWGLPVGLVTLSSEPVPAEEIKKVGANKNIQKLTLSARSNWSLEFFYPVRVKLVSFMDSETISPRRFEASVRRRWRTHESVVTFDQVKGQAYHQLPKNRSSLVSISPYTQDGLSLLYYVRTLEMAPGAKIPLEISADGKNWNVNSQIVRTRVLHVQGLGKISVVEGCAELAYPVPFFQGGKAVVWLSADEQRLPLYARIQSRIGPVTVVLVKRVSAPISLFDKKGDLMS